MVEKTLPWWRKAMQYAFGGIRSGFGLFPQSAKPVPYKENPVLDQREAQQKKETIPEEKVALTDHSPNPETVAGEPAIQPDPVVADEQVAEVAAEPVIEQVIVQATEEQTLAEASSPVPTSLVELPVQAGVLTRPAVEPLLTAAEPEVDLLQEAVLVSVPEIVPEQRASLSIESVVEVASAAEPIPVLEPVPEAGVEPVILHTPADASAPIELIDLGTLETATDAVPPLVLSSKPVRKQKTVQPAIIAEPGVTSVAALGSLPVTVQLAEPTAYSPSAIESFQSPVPIIDQATPAVELSEAPEVAPTLVLTSKDIAEPKQVDQRAIDKAGDKAAAKQKARDEEAEESPFSVFVGQVYDGPLDLLLDLIRKQDIDIYDIPIAKITAQFLAYVNQLKATDVDVAGEFIYTASLLIHIKSKMLLPRAPSGPEDAAEDPRRELVEKLLEHERFKNAAQMLQQKQMLESATWTNPGLREFKDDAAAEPEIAADTVDLVRIFRDILERARKRPVFNVEEDSVTVGQMIQFLGRRLTMEDKPVALRRLLSHTRSERALIAMFLALLELVRLQAILLRQDRAFSEIFVKKHSGFDAVMNEGLANARDDWR